jgi:serine/threonine protein kinase/tetratricopeptide (TPR) repeat protein
MVVPADEQGYRDMTGKRWQEIRSVLEPALLMDPAKRSAYLDQACASDQSLRREVESLLAADQQARTDFLRSPSLRTRLVKGTRLGEYEIQSLLGAGGMGEVYRARDLRLRREVAVKILPIAVSADRGRLRRFEQEAMAAAALSHPNILAVHHLGTYEGTPYLVSELLQGETLREHICRGPIGVRCVIDYGVQIAQGLAAAHEKGIVHRDLKPENLFVTRDERVKILDFGLAKLTQRQPDPEDSARTVGSETEPGLVMGTAGYMSPEQVRGQEADHRADIFSFGAVLYEMVTGRRAFQKPSSPETMTAILNEDPTEISRFVSNVPPALQRIVQRCLEKTPERRFQSTTDLRFALEALSGSGSVRSEGVERAGPRWNWMAASLVTVALIAVVGGILFFWRAKTTGSTGQLFGWDSAQSGYQVREKGRRSVAVLGFKNLSAGPEAAWLSTALSEMLTTELAGGEQLRVIPGENVARTKSDLSLSETDDLSRDTLKHIRRNLGSDFVVLGSYLDLGKESDGQIRLDLRVENAAEGETVAYLSETGTEAQLLDLVSRSGADLRAKLGVGSVAATQAASIAAALPSNSEAARLYAQGIAKLRVFDALGARDLLEKGVAADPNNPLLRSALATAWSTLGYDEKAKTEAERAMSLSSTLSREERLWVKARYHETAKDWDLAIGAYRTLFDFFPDNIEYGLRLAEVQTGAGKVEDALATAAALRQLPAPDREDPRIDQAEAEADVSGNYRQGLSAAMRAVEKGRAEGARLLVARALSTQASLLYKLGESQRSVAVAEESQRIYAEAGDQVGVARQLLVIGRVLSDQGEFSQAMNTFDQAVPIFLASGNNKGMASALNDKAIVLFQQGDFAGAKKQYEQALGIYREIGDRSGEGSALGNLGNTLSQLGDLAGARKMYAQALAIHREVGKQSGVALWLTNIGLVLSDQGDLAGAKKAFEQSLEVSRRIGDKSYAAYALYGLGAALAMGADFEKAKAAYSEALTLRNEIGETGNAAAAQVALAELSLEEGHPTEAETTIRNAREVFRKTAQVEDEINADALLLRTLLAKGEIAEASHEMEQAEGLVKQNHDRGMRLDFAISAARVLAASGDIAKAKNGLKASLAEAAKYGYVAEQFDARLALGEVEMKTGQTVAGHAGLATLEKDARAKGFLLVARKATAAAKSSA